MAMRSVMAGVMGALTIGGSLADTAQAAPVPTMTRLTSQRFNVTMTGLGFTFQPFDPALGELQRVAVQGHTVVAATGTAFQWGSESMYPVGVQIDVNVSPTTTGTIGFSNPWTYIIPVAGMGPGPGMDLPSTPIGFGALQTFSFTIDQLADAGGVAPVHTTSQIAGTAIPPIQAYANFDTFTAAGAGVGSLVNITQTVITPGDVAMNPAAIFGGNMIVQYDYIPHDLGDNQLDDGGFDDGLGNWDADGPGAADTVSQGVGNGNTAGRLTTSSPIALSQLVNTPDGAFRIAFDYAFLTEAGSLAVALDAQALATLDSPLTEDLDDPSLATFEHFSLDVTDGSLQGLTEALFELSFDGPADSQVLIDNVWLAPITAVPEPATLGLLTLAGAMLLRRGRVRGR